MYAPRQKAKRASPRTSIMRLPMRSLTEPPELKNSHLASSSHCKGFKYVDGRANQLNEKIYFRIHKIE